MKHTLACTISSLLIANGLFAAPLAPLSRESAAAFLQSLKEAKQNAQTAPAAIPEVPVQTTETPSDDARQQPPQPPQPPPPPPRPDLNRAVVFIHDAQNRSCGFLMDFWGKTVIVTTANTFVRMRNPVVENANRERFEIVSALTGKTADLALLELKTVPESLLPLARPTAAQYKIGDEITVSGERRDNVMSLFQSKIRIKAIEAKRILLEFSQTQTEPQLRRTPVVTQVGDQTIIQPGWVLDSPKSDKTSKWPDTSGGPALDGNGDLFGIVVQDWEINRLETLFDGAGTFYFQQLDAIDLEDFEYFDLAAQEKDLEFYAQAEPVRQRCIREFHASHYSWKLYGRNGKRSDYSQINTYLYCHNQFTAIRFHEYFHYRASSRIFQRILEQQRKHFIALGYLLHVSPTTLSQQEKTYAEWLFQSLQRLRRNKFICRQCGGTGQIGKVSGFGESGIRKSTCDHCHGEGTANVVYYGPMRSSPIVRFPYSPHEISGFRLGMDIDAANKVANEQWRRNTAQFNIINFNGLIDNINVGRNPEYANRALFTQLKFLARRLQSCAVYFENDQHNFQNLYDAFKEKFGAPEYEVRTGDWSYVLFVTQDSNIMLTIEGNYVVFRAYNRVLQHLETLLLETFEQTLFSPPLKKHNGSLYYQL